MVDTMNPVDRTSAFVTSAEPVLDMDTATLRIAIPADIQAVKESDLPLAIDWREKTRRAFQHYFARGYIATSFSREEGWGSYLLERDALFS